MPETGRKKRPIGWILLILLVGVYVAIKFQVWGYAQRVQELEAQLEKLRPTLSAKVTYDQLSVTHGAYLEASEQIQKIHLQVSPLLQQLSKELPVSITLEKIEAESGKAVRIWGEVLPGIRSPEAVLVPWAQRLRSVGAHVRIEKLESSPHGSGRAAFILTVEGG